MLSQLLTHIIATKKLRRGTVNSLPQQVVRRNRELGLASIFCSLHRNTPAHDKSTFYRVISSTATKSDTLYQLVSPTEFIHAQSVRGDTDISPTILFLRMTYRKHSNRSLHLV